MALQSLPTTFTLNDREYQILSADITERHIIAEYKAVARGYEIPESKMKFDVDDLAEFEERLMSIGVTL